MEEVPRNATEDVLAEAAIALKAVGRFSDSEDFAQRELEVHPSQKVASGIIAAYDKDQQRFVNSKNNKEDTFISDENLIFVRVKIRLKTKNIVHQRRFSPIRKKNPRDAAYLKPSWR